MSDAAYDNDNVFAKILRGEMPAVKLYEDEATLSFMDIMPRGEGHLLVIPKTPSRNILDIDPKDLAKVMETVQKLGRAAIKAFGADGLTISQFNEPAGGQVIFHTHFHVLPRFEGVPLKPPSQDMADVKMLEEQAAKVRAALGEG